MTNAAGNSGAAFDRTAEGRQQADNRRAVRMRTLKAGRAVFDNAQSVVDCVIKNLSDNGAQIELDAPGALPNTFLLQFQDGRKRPVEVTWRSRNRVGLRFVDGGLPMTAEQHASVAKMSLLTQLEDIEHQLQALRNEMMIHLKD